MSKYAFLTNSELQSLSEALERAIYSSASETLEWGSAVLDSDREEARLERNQWGRMKEEIDDKLEDRKCTR